ncbi:hypothetical protein [Wenzhouxiangella marina]|uniref:Uncharacterized protein n=1 Tax=Wenzhouxiangella marina TaxID=1579979 RepID=A0A0K0XT53_9GAMM|nr:hypothetical protein [Wenzhouxiangella marina]AKS40802.1 hypothetical protein WM2015_419 [Wenzhouxiangella marina]MBB6087675.1 hypothetical protein [Wenzhouxiangella marina]
MTALALLLACSSSPLAAALSDAALAWHWQASTADRARQASLALELWLAEPETDAGQWRAGVETHRLALAAAADQVLPEQAPMADGLFAWLVHARERNLQTLDSALPTPDLDRVSELLAPDRQAGRLARMQSLIALQAPEVWNRLAARLASVAVVDPASEIEAYWQTLMRPPPAEPVESELPGAEGEEMDEAADPEEGAPATAADGLSVPAGLPEPEAEALEQAGRVRRLAELEDAQEKAALRAEIIRIEAGRAWARGERLNAAWLSLEALSRITGLEAPASEAAAMAALLESFSAEPGRNLRQTDSDLPAILALLEDAALNLAGEAAGVAAAMAELADAYARLALFAGDAAYYLDQPVREDLRAAVASCTADPLLVGPLPREVFERCLERLVELMSTQLGREELVGDGDGPYSALFLRREMGLVSWQRAAYLDGHLNWLLGSSCTAPSWENPLEWSLLAQYLASWVSQRPVFFDSPRWREAVDVFARQANRQRVEAEAFIDCLTGTGGQRRDPVERLLDLHERALVSLGQRVVEASGLFYAEVTRPLADIDLDGDAAQQTGYRPEALTVGPCPEAQVCGVRAALPVSRALLGQFPNAYLLADQLRMGQLSLCYDEVRWVDRQQRPAANEDPRVANYDGYLSFDLVGSFDREGVTEVVFRQRLRAAEPRHYLFASSDPAVLEMDCPDELAGQPIPSQLPTGHLGLVPDRLTYFVSQPTTAEAEILANWELGAEWRDWFVTGDRVESIESSAGTELALEVQAELSSLASRRERQLATRLLSPLNAVENDPLATAMAEVADNTGLLRRILELHYPRVIRHDEEVRALLSGESGLLTRDRLRQLRDSGVPLAQAAAIGRDRLTAFRERWRELPVPMRELGQVSPEMDFAAERLDELRRLSRSWLEPAESLPVQ